MLIFRGLPGAADPYVKIRLFDFRTSTLLEVLNQWSIITEKSVFINAIDNGVHGDNATRFTFHGLSLAWDLGVDGNLHDDYVSLANFLGMRLPPPYQILVETDHVHVEWDTGKGR